MFVPSCQGPSNVLIMMFSSFYHYKQPKSAIKPQETFERRSNDARWCKRTGGIESKREETEEDEVDRPPDSKEPIGATSIRSKRRLTCVSCASQFSMIGKSQPFEIVERFQDSFFREIKFSEIEASDELKSLRTCFALLK